MDRVANRPRGFAFLRYATEEESKKAIEGMHGKVCKLSVGNSVLVCLNSDCQVKSIWELVLNLVIFL